MPKTTIDFKVPNWIKVNKSGFFISAIFFITAILFFPGSGSFSGQLLQSQLDLTTGSPPGSPLSVLLFQPFLLLPIGSIWFRLFLFNVVISTSLIWFFTLFISQFTKNRIIAPGVALGFGASLLFFRNLYGVSDVSLTLLFILIMFTAINGDLILKQKRKILLFTFLTGFGIGALHPSIRFLIPPLAFLWMVSFHIDRKLFSVMPLFFLLGLGIILFIPLTASRSSGYWMDISSIKDVFSYLSSRPQLDFYGSRTLSTHQFIWWPDLKALILHLTDSFPLFMIPFFLVGIFPGNSIEDKRKYYTFLGIGAAAFLHIWWMSPYTIREGRAGLFILAALWTGTAVGLDKISLNIKSNYGRIIFSSMVLIIAIVSAFVMDNGEKFRKIDDDHRKLGRDLITHIPQNSILLVEENLFSLVVSSDGVEKSAKNIKIIPFSRRYPSGSLSKFKKLLKEQKSIYSTPGVPLPQGYYLQSLSPWFGRVTSEKSQSHGVEKTNYLLRYFLSRVNGAVLQRRWIGSILTSWGEYYEGAGYFIRAGKFASYALFMVPSMERAMLLKSRVLVFRQEPFAALDLLKHLLSLDGSLYGAHLLMGQINLLLVTQSYIPPNDNISTLRKSVKSAKRATILNPKAYEPWLLRAKIELQLNELKKALNFANQALKLEPENKIATTLIKTIKRNLRKNQVRP
jgi:tetratricopeptide (TPR) repeat protein